MDASTILGQVPEFEAEQGEKCRRLGIDVSGFGLSHVAVRCRTWREYVAARDALEQVSTSNLENVWNGRPISKLVLAEPVALSGGRSVSLVELIPPFHQRVYKMGLEHIGYVLGDGFERFAADHSAVLTGQQFQSALCKPVYILFPDYTHVKFYETSLRDVCALEVAAFTGFDHADWSPADPDAGPYEVG